MEKWTQVSVLTFDLSIGCSLDVKLTLEAYNDIGSSEHNSMRFPNYVRLSRS